MEAADTSSDSETTALLSGVVPPSEEPNSPGPLIEDEMQGNGGNTAGQDRPVLGLFLMVLSPLVYLKTLALAPFHRFRRPTAYQRISSHLSPLTTEEDAMRVLTPLFFALAANQAIHALPVTGSDEKQSLTGEVIVSNLGTDLAVIQSVNDQEDTLAVLESRAVCRTLNRVVNVIGTSRNKLIYITASGVLARSICNLAHYDACNEVAYAVAAGLTILFTIASEVSGGEAVPVPTLPGPRDIISYQDFLLAALEKNQIQYARIEAAPFERAEKRSEDEPSLTERFLIKGLVDPSNSSAHDIYVHYYSNGGAVLHLPLSGEEANSTTGTLHKRYNKPGLKISYTTRRRSLLTKAHQNAMAKSIGSYWASMAHSTSMSEYVGFEETDHYANFYFRIIPELKAFGTSYENVNVCGGMARFL